MRGGAFQFQPVVLAKRCVAPIRKESMMTLKWIAEGLQMGSRIYVSNLLQAQARSAPNPKRRRSVKSED